MPGVPGCVFGGLTASAWARSARSLEIAARFHGPRSQSHIRAVTVTFNTGWEFKNDSQPSVLSLRGGLGPPQVCFDFIITISSGIIAAGELGEGKDLHEALGAAGLLMASVISADS